MAARRLIIALIALLLLSTLAAAFLPTPSGHDTSTTSTGREHARRPPASAGRLVHATVDAGVRHPQAIPLHGGDELVLRVRSRTPDQADVHGFGEVQAVDRFSPARFDLLATRPGTFPVRLLEAHRTIARIQVSPRNRSSNERPGHGAGSG